MSVYRKPLPTKEYLERHFRYDTNTGQLFWRERPLEEFARVNAFKMWNGKYVGKEAGSIDVTTGYRKLRLAGMAFPNHRVIWKLVTGKDPIDEIDHRNGNRADNSFANLREATKSQNQHNSKLRKDNATGYKCVFKYEYGYRAVFEKDKKKINLGCFRTAEEAYLKYCEAVVEYHHDFARTA